MRIPMGRAALLAALTVLACSKVPAKGVQLGQLIVEVSIDPDPPFAGDNRLHLEIHDGQGSPIDGVKLRLSYDMAAMGAMPAMKGEGEAKALGSGRYEIGYTLPMTGDWKVSVAIEAPGVSAQELKLKVSPPRKGFSVLGGDHQVGASTKADIGTPAGAMAGMPGMGGGAGMPSEGAGGKDTVTLSLERQQLSGITFGIVEKRPLTAKLLADGRVRVDERALSDVTLRYEGYVEKLFVAETGKKVTAGQALARVYSPDLLSAEQELLDLERGGQSHGDHTSALVDAVRRKLSLWDLSASQIADLERRSAADGTVIVHAPISGVVLEKDVVEGTHTTPGMVLFRLGNLGRSIWVEAQMYESDAPLIEVGEPASVSLPALGGHPYPAHVTFVAPIVDEKTRTLTARLELTNVALALKPGMYADVRIDRPLGEQLAVPDSALLLSGEHRYAFVERGPGRLAPVEVQVGVLADGWDQVLSGLDAGDRVVTGATFLVASEAQLEGVLARWQEAAADGGVDGRVSP